MSDLAQEDPVELIRQMVRRDAAAFQRFYDRFAPLAYTFAMRILRSRPDAEDLLQEVFLQAWRQAETYDLKRGRPEAWIITMVKSRAIDRIRSARRRDKGIPVFEEAARRKTFDSEGRETLKVEARITLQGVIAELSEVQRAALELAYFEGFTQTEIAEKLGVPVGTVKTRIRDGLMKLKERFKAGGGS